MNGVSVPFVALAASGNELYAGGDFGWAGEGPARNIAKWDGSRWSALGSGVNGGVFALVVAGNELFATGGFDTAGGKVSHRVAHAYLDLPILSVVRSGSNVTFSWPSSFRGFVLQQNSSVTNDSTWSNPDFVFTTNGATISATVGLTSSDRFFRLSRN